MPGLFLFLCQIIRNSIYSASISYPWSVIRRKKNVKGESRERVKKGKKWEKGNSAKEG